MGAQGCVQQFGSARRQRHVSAAAALVVLLALVPCASAVYRSWWPEVPWCVKCTLPDPPGKWWNKCTYPKVLDEGVVQKGWKLIDFPSVKPEHPEQWPNRPGDQEVLRQCKYIAFNSGLHDGVGSQYQRVMWLVAFAMKHNVSFVDLPLTYAQHGADTYEAFTLFNLGYGFTPFDQIPNNATICLAERCGPHQSLELKPAIAEKVRRGNFSGGPLTDFTWNKVIVAIHIRRGDVGDVTPREGRWVPDTFFEDIVRNMSSTLDGLREGRNGYEFHIFSEGQLNTTFANMSAAVAHLPVVWHLNGDPMRALRGIMCSDILVMAQSAFSFIAADWFTSATTIIVEPWTNWVPEEQEALKSEKLPWTLYGLQERADGRQYLGGC